MNLSDISLPYPVLGVNADVMPVLPADAVTVVNGEDDKCFTFSISLKYSNNDILRLVDEGIAVHTCEYGCSKTMTRRCVKTATPQFNITIPRTAVARRINFNAYVTVVKPISRYVNSGLNDDYKGETFDMEPGDILVIAQQLLKDPYMRMFDKLIGDAKTVEED